MLLKSDWSSKIVSLIVEKSDHVDNKVNEVINCLAL